MAFGYVTYKTFAPVNQIGSNLTNSEGCGLTLTTDATVYVATSETDIPYAILAVGCDSITPGTYPSAPVAGSLEVIDQLGCAVQALASDSGAIVAGQFVYIDSAASVPGSFKDAGGAGAGDYVWGLALTSCAAGEQFIFRFQPSIVP